MMSTVIDNQPSRRLCAEVEALLSGYGDELRDLIGEANFDALRSRCESARMDVGRPNGSPQAQAAQDLQPQE